MPYEEEARLEKKIDEILNRLEKIAEIQDKQGLRTYHINKHVEEIKQKLNDVFTEQ